MTIDTYGLSRIVLRLLREGAKTIGELDREIGCSRDETLRAIHSLERRGYQIIREWSAPHIVVQVAS